MTKNNALSTFAIHTLGCKANSYDSECIRTSFISSNYIEKNFNDFNVDIYVINTCAVTNKSEAKSRKFIRQACAKKNKNSIVCVVGCYSQIKSKEIKKIKGVDLVLGTENKSELVNIIEKNLRYKELLKIKEVLFAEKYDPKSITINSFKNNTRAFVKIQDGCNNFCSFCIIPYTRGKLRSRNSDQIIEEIKMLVKNNHKEIVLTGIHTAGYGEDFKKYNFYQLLKDIIENVKELKRLRISSIEASQISKEILLLLKNSNKIVPHLHIPLQSGSNKILSLMERKYSREQYLDTIKKIREILPNIAITTDIIVGFPGENIDTINDSINFYKKIDFSEIHVFPYSKKNDTPAAQMKQTNEFLKKIWTNSILDLNKKLALNYIKKQKKPVNVLFEKKNNDNYYYGYSENYIKIKCFSKKDIVNKILKVKIIEPNYPVSLGKLI